MPELEQNDRGSEPRQVDAGGASSRFVKRLMEYVDQGVFVAGQPLPSERALARKMNVDRGTVHRSMELLRQEGLIKRVSPRKQVLAVGMPVNQDLLSDTVAVLSVKPRTFANHRRPGWVEFITLGVMEESENAGFHTVLVNPDRLNAEVIGQLLRARPRGTVLGDFLGHENEQQVLSALCQAGLPFVVYGNALGLRQYDRVSSNHFTGGYELTRRLIEMGRRRILCLWHDVETSYWLAERRAGYEKAMREAGLTPLPTAEVPAVPRGSIEGKKFELAARTIAGFLAEHLSAAEPIDAIEVTSDGDLSYVSAACRCFHKTPGEDILLAGYDFYWKDSPEQQHEVAPPAVTVNKRNVVMGHELVRLLQDRIGGSLPPEPQLRLVEPVLIMPGADD